MARTRDLDPIEQRDLDKAFAKVPSTGQEIVPAGGRGDLPGMTITDAVITARKVEVERDEAKVLRRIKALAAAAGDDWFYRFPVKNRKTGKTDWIEGPSVKCANNVARLFGNCQVDTRVLDAGDSWIIYARFVDYETGFSMTRPFQQGKGASRLGGEDQSRRLDIAFQIGVSKAIRNVVCNALEVHTNYAFEEAKENLVGRVGRNLTEYKARTKERIEGFGIELKQVEAQVGRPLDQWLAPDVARVIAEIKAIQDGMATVDETWPLAAPPEPKRDDEPAPAAAEPAAQAEPPAADPAPRQAAPVADDAAPLPGSSSPHEESPPESPSSSGDAAGPSSQEPPKRNWSVGDALGQDAVLKRLDELLSLTRTISDVDELERQNAERIAKITGTKAGGWRNAVRARRDAINRGDDA